MDECFRMMWENFCAHEDVEKKYIFKTDKIQKLVQTSFSFVKSETFYVRSEINY